MESIKKDSRYSDSRESFSSCVDNLNPNRFNLSETSENDYTDANGQESTANAPLLTTKAQSLAASKPNYSITDKLS